MKRPILLAAALLASALSAQTAMDAQFVSCNVPTTLTTDEVFFAEITMRNSGTSPWSQYSDGVKTTLVSTGPDFNTTWGAWFIIQGQGSNVAPGSTFTFHSWLRAPSAPGDYSFNWRCQNWIPEGGYARKDKPYFGQTAVGPVIHVVARTETPPEPVHRSGVLERSDFAYVGSFRVPGLSGFDDVYNDNGIALRTVGGAKHLLLVAGTYSSRLYEVVLPTPVPIIDGDWSATPVAPLVRDWGALNYGTIGGESIEATGGLWHDDTTSTLYWTHANGYFCGGPSDFPQLLATQLAADGTKTNVGYWHIPGTVSKYKGYWGGVTKLPPAFAAAYTGGRELALGFGGYFSICGTASRGPALGAIATPGASGTTLDLRELLTFIDPVGCPRDGEYFDNIGYWGTQPLNPWTGWWTGTDECHTGVFIDLPDKHGYVTFAYQGIGRLGYDYGGYNADGHWRNCWYFFDPADLGDAGLGQRSANGIPPSSFSVADLPLPGSAITGACFDADTRMLYLYTKQSVDRGHPIIHAYRVTAEAPATYATWRTANFTSADLTNDAISGPDADPDGCGVSNLQRYAFALQARGPITNPITPDTADTTKGRVLTLTFPRRITAEGLTYTLESSSDLVTWTAVPDRTYTAGAGPITAPDAVTIGTAARRFLRIRITQQ